eukprot:s477_g7.t1
MTFAEERIVLPRGTDFTKDILDLLELGQAEVELYTADFTDAFLNLPIDPAERQFAVVLVDTDQFAAYRGVPFGLATAPLVWGRMSAWIGRATQALPPWQHRLQIYVDDPAGVVAGSLAERDRIISKTLALWSALGARIALHKACRGKNIKWIGANYTILHGLVPGVRSLAGELSWIAGLVPTIRPFVNMVWAALYGMDTHRHKATTGQSSARARPVGAVFAKTIRVPMIWMKRFLRGQHGGLQRVRWVADRYAHPQWVIRTDASISGMGGILLNQRGEPVRWWAGPLHPATLQELNVPAGEPGLMTVYELLAVVTSLHIWQRFFRQCRLGLLVQLDSESALRVAVKLASPHPVVNRLAAEMSLRLESLNAEALTGQHWRNVINLAADALSRLAEGKEVPARLRCLPRDQAVPLPLHTHSPVFDHRPGARAGEMLLRTSRSRAWKAVGLTTALVQAYRSSPASPTGNASSGKQHPRNRHLPVDRQEVGQPVGTARTDRTRTRAGKKRRNEMVRKETDQTGDQKEEEATRATHQIKESPDDPEPPQVPRSTHRSVALATGPGPKRWPTRGRSCRPHWSQEAQGRGTRATLPSAWFPRGIMRGQDGSRRCGHTPCPRCTIQLEGQFMCACCAARIRATGSGLHGSGKLPPAVAKAKGEPRGSGPGPVRRLPQPRRGNRADPASQEPGEEANRPREAGRGEGPMPRERSTRRAEVRREAPEPGERSSRKEEGEREAERDPGRREGRGERGDPEKESERGPREALLPPAQSATRLSPEEAKKVVALLKAQGYRSAELYLSAAMSRHKAHHQVDGPLTEAGREATRMAQRGRGPPAGKHPAPLPQIDHPHRKMLMTGVWYLLRVSEVIALTLEDVAIRQSVAGWTVALTIRSSKTDQEARSETVARDCVCLSERSTEAQLLCPAHILWEQVGQRLSELRAVGYCGSQAPLFTTEAGERLSERYVLSAVEQAAEEAGEPLKDNGRARFGTHSLRVAGAVLAFQAGLPEPVVRSLGRWRSERAMLAYLRGVPLVKGYRIRPERCCGRCWTPVEAPYTTPTSDRWSRKDVWSGTGAKEPGKPAQRATSPDEKKKKARRMACRSEATSRALCTGRETCEGRHPGGPPVAGGSGQAYLYTEGLVRFCSEAFTLDPAQLCNSCVHLTNNEVNAKNAKAATNRPGGGSANCGNWRLSKLLSWLRGQSQSCSDLQDLWPRLRRLVVDVLQAARPQIAAAVAELPSEAQRRCFELFGFDVLVDESLRPWLCEVNSLPSLGIGGLEDLEVDRDMLSCLFAIIFEAPSEGAGGAIDSGCFELLEPVETVEKLEFFVEGPVVAC